MAVSYLYIVLSLPGCFSPRHERSPNASKTLQSLLKARSSDALNTNSTTNPTIRYSPRLKLLPKLPPEAFDIGEFGTVMGEAFGIEEEQRPVRDPDSDEGTFFDLKPPASTAGNVKLEDLVKRLFSPEHLHFILGDHNLFHRFSAFLNRYRPYLVPTLVRYLEMRKVMKAIEYANAVAKKIRWPTQSDHYRFSGIGAASTDGRFDDFASKEMLLLVSEALPAFVTFTLIDTVGDCVARDITGQGIPVFRELVGELGEIFCLTDPSTHDNPIIYASEEFHKTTQYGTTFAIDRNCRFLQGPGTDKNCTLRLAQAIARGEESMETLLNYRRDGSPFVNLLMCAPLYDDKGIVRYFIGAQVDVSGLVEEGRGIESFRALLQNDQADNEDKYSNAPDSRGYFYKSKVQETLSRLQELSSMFSQDESDVVFRNSRAGAADNGMSTDASSISNGISSVKNRNQTKRIIATEQGVDFGLNFSNLGLGNIARSNNLPGVYKHYLLVRPYPSLKIIFVSPSLRLPGLLRTHLFSKLGGPTQTMAALEDAFRDGASVTAKILWLPKNSHTDRGRQAEVKPRWIRCTPLLGSDDRVGVWMIILVPADIDPTGYRSHVADLVDEVAADRKRMEMYSTPSRTRNSSRAPSRTGSRGNGSIDGYDDGGFDLKKKVIPTASNGSTRHGRTDNFYAEYLRSSPSTGGSREDIRRRKDSDATRKRESGASEIF